MPQRGFKILQVGILLVGLRGFSGPDPEHLKVARTNTLQQWEAGAQKTCHSPLEGVPRSLSGSLFGMLWRASFSSALRQLPEQRQGNVTAGTVPGICDLNDAVRLCQMTIEQSAMKSASFD